MAAIPLPPRNPSVTGKLCPSTHPATAYNREQRQDTPHFFLLKIRCTDHNCEHTFQAVSQKCHCSCFFATVYAAHSLFLHFRFHACGYLLLCAFPIMITRSGTGQKHSLSEYRSIRSIHFTQLFSPVRSRIINFREVPRNPNASRIFILNISGI